MKNKHIAVGAIFTALIVVLVGLSLVIPGIELLFIFFLPFFASYVSFEYGIKKSIPFLFASLILSFLLSYITAILYIFPSLISGICYGLMAKKIKRIIDLTFIMSFIEGLLFAISILMISFVLDLNIESDIATLINMDVAKFKDNIYLFLFLIGLTQSSLTSLIVIHNYQTLKLKEFELSSGLLIFIFHVLSIALMIIFMKTSWLIRLSYGIYFVTLIAQIISSFKVALKYNWIIITIQIFTFLFISIPLLTIINDSLKLFVYSWFLLPLVVKNCFQVFNFKQ